MKNRPQKILSIMKSHSFRVITICGLLIVLFTFLLFNYKNVVEFCSAIIGALRPFITGCIIAFALNRPVMKFYNWLKAKKTDWKNEKIPFRLSITAVYLISVSALIAVVCVVIPQISRSIGMFIENFDLYYMNLKNFLSHLLEKINLGWLESMNILDKIYGLTRYVPSLLSKTFDMTANIFSVLVDFVLGIVFSVYILSDREKLLRQLKSLFSALLPEKIYSKTYNFLSLVNETFMGFLCGQFTEALIVGALCFIGMLILRFEYPLLISVIIGLTNIIPVLGPFIGTVPCVLILLLVNPYHAIWFTVFVVILQQVESNFIYPRVVGNSVGLPAMWVLFAVVTGGSLFGIWGMVIGIPAVSVIYSSVKKFVHKKQKNHF